MTSERQAMSKEKKPKTAPKAPIEKKTGIAHFFAAAQYSWAGFKFMLGEVPFRHELFALAIIMIILFYVGATPLIILITLCLAITTLAIEAINSAIELIVDRTSPEISEYAKNAKDVGSFAVCAMMIATGCAATYGLYNAI